MSTFTFVTIQAKANPIPFYAPDSTLTVLGQAEYTDQIQDWQNATLPYQYKCMMDDQVTLQFHTQFVFAGGSCLMRILDVNKNQVISSATMGAAPFYKGMQTIAGNNFKDPFTSSVYQLITNTWSFKFSDFAITDGGIYYLEFRNVVSGGATDKIYYSEPILLSNQELNTRQFIYSYDANNSNKNIVVSGLFDDYPTNSIAYSPQWTLRCEAYRARLNLKVLQIGYLQQGYSPEQIKTLSKRGWTLRLGEATIGVSEYILDKVTEAITADMWWFDNYSYILPFEGNSTNLAELWKVQGAECDPLLYASTAVMERYDEQQALVTPTPSFPSHIFTGVFSDVFM